MRRHTHTECKPNVIQYMQKLNQKMLFPKNNIDLDGIRFGFMVRRIDLKKSDKENEHENETIPHNTTQHKSVDSFLC